MTGGGGRIGTASLSRRGVGGVGVGGGDDGNDGTDEPPRYDRTGFGTTSKRGVGGGGGVHHRAQSPPVEDGVDDDDGRERRKGHGGGAGFVGDYWPSVARRLILSMVHRLREGRMTRRSDRDLLIVMGGCCLTFLLLLLLLRGGGGGDDARGSSPPHRIPISVMARPPAEHLPLFPSNNEPGYEPDYGDIEIRTTSSAPGGGTPGRARRVIHRFWEGESYLLGPRERLPTPVYFDDDSSNIAAGIEDGDNAGGSGGYMRNFVTKRREKKRDRKKGRGGRCRDTANKMRFHPTCNVVHGYSILDDDGWYKGKGAFREVIGFFSDDDERRSNNLNGTVPTNFNFARPVPFVMKIERSLKKKRDADEIRQQIRVDAMVMETLTSSPAICDIYSHCGTTVVTERLYEEAEDIVIPGEWYMKHSDLNDSKDVDPQNEPPLTPTDKLRIAYEMAQGIASLHGNPGGVIVHDDHRLCQYLRDGTGRIKLNDFNRAEVMKWNEEEGEYCRYPNHGAWGNHRSPEEYRGKLLSEKIDVYSMGNNIYSLLTGLDVYYENEDDAVAQGFIKKGELPFIDDRYKTRSYAEGALVKILLRCWVYDPNERADIFEVLNFLREAVETNARLEAEGKTKL